MKTTNLFKAVAFVAMVIVSIMNSEVKAQDRFITNEEVQNDLIVAKIHLQTKRNLPLQPHAL